MKKLTAMLLALIVLLAAAIPALASGMLRTGGEAHECDALCEHEHDCEHDEAENAEHRTADGEREEHEASEHREYEEPEEHDPSEHRESVEPEDNRRVTPEPVELPPYEGEVSEETRELWNKALEWLSENTFFAFTFLCSEIPTMSEYEGLKLYCQDLRTLEEREDAALCLLEKYEEYADRVREYDCVAMEERRLEFRDVPNATEKSEAYRSDWNFKFGLSNIEALFAQGPYLERLMDEQRQRFDRAYTDIWKIFNAAHKAVWGESEEEQRSYFDTFKDALSYIRKINRKELKL